MKLCVDCKYYERDEWDFPGHKCMKYAITNPVTGVGFWGATDCEVARGDDGFCKIHGVHWEKA